MGSALACTTGGAPFRDAGVTFGAGVRSFAPGLGLLGMSLPGGGLVVSGASAVVCELPPPRSSIIPVSTAASTSTAAAPIQTVFEFRKDAGAVPPLDVAGRTAAVSAAVCIVAAA